MADESNYLCLSTLHSRVSIVLNGIQWSGQSMDYMEFQIRLFSPLSGIVS